jgi:hypothetical protein
MTIRVYTEGEAEEKALPRLLRRELEALRDRDWGWRRAASPGRDAC